MAKTQPMTDSFIAASQNEDTISYASSSQHDETVDLADDDEAFNFEEYMEEIEKQEEQKTAKDPLTAATMELIGKQKPALSTSSGKGVGMLLPEVVDCLIETLGPHSCFFCQANTF